jgi:hypothetical protein
MVDKQHRVMGIFSEGAMILYLVILAFVFAGGGDLQAQHSPFDPEYAAEAAGIHEQVDCFTDRSLYICGELIRFRANLFGFGLADPGAWSTVLYVELVGADGELLAQGKFPLDEQFASGEIKIPDQLLSGTYYLRSYTRWMRNRGPEKFCHVPLRIVNPGRHERVGEITPEDAGTSLLVRSSKKELLDFNAHPGSYERGDPVSMDLLLTGTDFPDLVRGCLTVVHRAARPSRLLGKEPARERDTPDDFQLSFLPDKFGPSLSGSVSYPESEEEELIPARVHFTLLGDQSAYFVCRSDAAGMFILGLPARTGKLELFVQPESPDDRKVEVRIDQDFDPRMVSLPVPPFSLSDEEKLAATIMSRNVQLSEIYSAGRILESEKDSATGATVIPFYGSPTRTVDLDEYVLLPTLKEVFLNLVPGVTPVTRKNKTSLKIYSENPSLSLYAPLVMIDQVPVTDVEKFLSISPSKIRRVDVIEDVYVKGDLRFGGIINLWSMEQDMAGIDLPDNSFFIDYLALHATESEAQEFLIREQVSPDDRMPDTRNTFLWMSDLTLVKGSSAKISFTAPEYPGEYLVLFRGQDRHGELIMAETNFTVR